MLGENYYWGYSSWKANNRQNAISQFCTIKGNTFGYCMHDSGLIWTSLVTTGK